MRHLVLKREARTVSYQIKWLLIRNEVKWSSHVLRENSSDIPDVKHIDFYEVSIF